MASFFIFVYLVSFIAVLGLLINQGNFITAAFTFVFGAISTAIYIGRKYNYWVI